MNEYRKAELRKSFAGKAVSEMNDEERQVFDADFQYGLSTDSKSEPFCPSSGFLAPIAA